MNHKEYINGVLRTESGRFDAPHVDPGMLKNVLTTFAGSARAVDALKRALYYGKPLDTKKLSDAMQAVYDGVREYLKRSEATLGAYSEQTNKQMTRVLHSSLGFATESGEIIEAVLKFFESGLFDWGNYFEELGDLNWYMALGVDAADHGQPVFADQSWTLESIWERNLAKLKARYPQKFESEKAYERDIQKEKEALEKGNS